MGRKTTRRHSPLPLAIGLLVALIGGLIALNAWGNRSPAGSGASAANAGDTQQVALGQQVYAANCASCHGANLEGQANWRDPLPNGAMPAPPHDATGHTWHHPDQQLFQIVKAGGTGGMPAFGGALSDEQIWAVLAYIKSTWPADIKAAQEQVTRQAQ